MAALLDIVKKGSTDRSVTVRIIDATAGTPETGVVFDTSGIAMWYRREGETLTAITEADLTTPALDDDHADGGFLHISDGEYRLDLPDAAFATGANHVDVGGTVTGMVVIGGRVRLVDWDPEDADGTALTEAGGDGDHLTEAGGDGDHLAEAGGDGDHLTAINLPNQTMDITGNITGNLSGSVGSVTGAVGSVTGAVGSVTAGVSLAAGAITDASLAGNMEIVFETDFATNYNATRNAWATNVQDFVGTSAADPFNAQVVAASVTGNVGGNVVGSVASVTGAINTAAGTITTLDGLDTAQDTQHGQTQSDIAALDTVVDGVESKVDTVDGVVDNLNLGIIYGAAATGTLSTTQATTDLTGYADDQLIGRIVTWLDGDCAGEQSDITDYANTGGLLTFTDLTTAPGDGDLFKIT